MPRVGLQLYTIKEEIQKDYLGTLEKVAQVGYEGVEFAGFYKTPVERIKQKINELNLLPAGVHVIIDELENNFEHHLKYCNLLEIQTIICPFIPDKYISSKEVTLQTAKRFNRLGKECKVNGFNFLFHIHGNEFYLFDGKYAIDLLIENTDPEYVNFEFDTFWVEYANIDSLELYKKYASRIPYIHFKDMKDKESKKGTEVGTGIVDIPEIIKVSKEYTLKWFVVEQEAFDISPLESIKISYKNLVTVQ
ncbi:sugar phosphate isomerase/epimerase family protein [Petroclostridium xylanilyticum]|uniref:sugar phosphate isomerase/epimerase family protein n=1 Tax=Petroclostridium xylanilyticum TaxID=1792311 RepID=UPI000B985ACF|nr:sugar phosphate isomerase/epimerase [Petroclostridium xylanilyticum]